MGAFFTSRFVGLSSKLYRSGSCGCSEIPAAMPGEGRGSSPTTRAPALGNATPCWPFPCAALHPPTCHGSLPCVPQQLLLTIQTSPPLSRTETYKITLLLPSYDLDNTLQKRKYANITRDDLKRIVEQSGCAGLVPLSELPGGAADADVDLEEVELQSPRSVQLVDGGKYLAVNLVKPLSKQVRARGV